MQDTFSSIVKLVMCCIMANTWFKSLCREWLLSNYQCEHTGSVNEIITVCFDIFLLLHKACDHGVDCRVDRRLEFQISLWFVVVSIGSFISRNTLPAVGLGCRMRCQLLRPVVVDLFDSQKSLGLHWTDQFRFESRPQSVIQIVLEQDTQPLGPKQFENQAWDHKVAVSTWWPAEYDRQESQDSHWPGGEADGTLRSSTSLPDINSRGALIRKPQSSAPGFVSPTNNRSHSFFL